MRSLKLKFPYSGQQSPVIDNTLLVLGALFLIIVLHQLKSTMGDVNHWQARVERIEKQQQQNQPVRRSSRSRQRQAGQGIEQEIKQEISKAGEVVDQINFPWESFFNAVEFAATKEVALLSLQPNVISRTVQIGGEAKSMSVLLDFVEALERETIFKNVHLLNYKVILDNQYHPISFLLTASWIQTS